jgi:hypothetical protein
LLEIVDSLDAVVMEGVEEEVGIEIGVSRVRILVMTRGFDRARDTDRPS